VCRSQSINALKNQIKQLQKALDEKKNDDGGAFIDLKKKTKT